MIEVIRNITKNSEINNWCKALASGKYTKARSYLSILRTADDNSKKYGNCCLGVWLMEHGGKPDETHGNTTGIVIGERDEGASVLHPRWLYDEGTDEPHVGSFFTEDGQFKDSEGNSCAVVFNGRHFYRNLVSMNDDLFADITFSDIAHIISRFRRNIFARIDFDDADRLYGPLRMGVTVELVKLTPEMKQLLG